jgi:Fe2+ transport system protein FeoA
LIDRTYGDDLVPLDRLPPGQPAFIERFVGGAEQVRRLEEIGLRPGTKVQVVRQGRPCIVRAGGNRLCIRCSDLLSIWVRGPKVAV